jgi:hypothetical protein
MNTEDQVAYTIAEWCGDAKFSGSLYYKLQRQGLGPRVARVGVRERTSPKRRANIPSAVNWKPNLQNLPLVRLCDSMDQTAEKALLARLCTGDVLAAQGKLKIGTYEKDGQTRVSFSILANSILPLRAPKKAKAQSGANFPACRKSPHSLAQMRRQHRQFSRNSMTRGPRIWEGRGDDWQRCSTAAARRSLGRRERTARLGHPRHVESW